MTKQSKFRELLSFMIIFCFMGLSYIIIEIGVTDASQNIAFALIGGVSGAFGQVVNYWLGTTKSSQDKTEMISNSIPLERADK